MLAVLIIAQLATTEVQPLVAKARLARYQQDSALAEYRAIARQRMSSGIGLSKVFGVGVPGPEKLAARFESVARVGWDHRDGAWGEVIGARGVAPIVGETKPDGETEVALVLPYHPGSDALWPMTELRGAFHDHRDWITHPLDAGSDSLYEFSLGELLTITLPSGGRLALREIVVRPHRPDEKLIVGSLWVDAATGNLVRAAYRPSTPVDLWPLMKAEVHGDEEDVMRRFGPYTGYVREVLIEHGLYEGRFWLPRIRTARGEGTAHGVRVTISIDQTFSYEKVRAMSPGESAAPITAPRDTAADGRVRFREWNGRVIDGPCRQWGDSSARWSPDSLAMGTTKLPVMYAQGIRYRVLTACVEDDLARSPALPGSIYDDGEALFTDTDFARLRRDVEGALSLGRQAKWEPQPSVVTWGWKRGMARYNRIEGLSLGVHVERTLGDGYSAEGALRMGVADGQPNAEATIKRGNLRSELRATAFRRLAAANAWGDPFALGPSAVALLFGRDDGLYYRAAGVEVGGTHQPDAGGAVWRWSLFGQRETAAAMQTNFSIPRLINGVGFVPNIRADEGMFGGASLVGMRAWGSDPRGTRLSALLRAEGAGGAANFARANVELGLSRGLGSRAEATLTGSTGSSLGDLPVQRLWYVGGPHSVRGFSPGDMVGESYWFARAELTQGHPVARPSIFADFGWAGPREALTSLEKPMSGVGVGLTLIDGVVRFDIARSSTGKFRADFYFDPR